MDKPKSLANKTGTLAPLKLPGVFSAPAQPIKARALAPYVSFAHPRRADEWAKIVAKYGQTVQEGSMYLIEPELITHLPQMKCTMLCCTQYWASVSAASEVLAVSLEEKPRPFKEHVEAVLLVYLEDRIVPVNVQFRSTKCPAAKALSDALVAASDPSWLERSAQHKETAVCNQPFMRYYGLVTIAPSRTSKSSGMTYKPTQCAVSPTALPEWRLLKAFCEDEATQKLLEQVAERYEQRVKEVMAKVA